MRGALREILDQTSAHLFSHLMRTIFKPHHVTDEVSRCVRTRKHMRKKEKKMEPIASPLMTLFCFGISGIVFWKYFSGAPEKKLFSCNFSLTEAGAYNDGSL